MVCARDESSSYARELGIVLHDDGGRMKNGPMYSKNGKIRNTILAVVAEEDPKRLRTRGVKPECGHGRKERPRRSNRVERMEGE